jgi:hypothetical protein
MKRTIVQGKVRKIIHFSGTYEGWSQGRLSQAAEWLGMRARSFRRCLARCEPQGEAGLPDRWLDRSVHGVPADDVLVLQGHYRERYGRWNMKHFFGRYLPDGGKLSYRWARQQLQAGNPVERGKRKSQHKKKRSRKLLPGMTIH